MQVRLKKCQHQSFFPVALYLIIGVNSQEVFGLPAVLSGRKD